MVHIITGRAASGAVDTHALHGMYRLRSEVFHERLGWAVEDRGGIERDEYDDRDPVYLVARGPGRSVSGCMRLLPTTGPYMLRDTFPALLRGEAAPADARIWDVSRFAVRADASAPRAAVSSSTVTVELVRAAIEHAFDTGIDSYVAVVSVGLERIFRRLGLPVRRFGDGRSQWVGDVRTVACWIDMTAEARRQVEHRVGRAA